VSSVGLSTWFNLKKWTPVMKGGAVAALLAVFTKSIDGIGRKLGSLGVQISDEAGHWFGVIEEVLELGIPLIIGVTILSVLESSRLRRYCKS